MRRESLPQEGTTNPTAAAALRAAWKKLDGEESGQAAARWEHVRGALTKQAQLDCTRLWSLMKTIQVRRWVRAWPGRGPGVVPCS